MSVGAEQADELLTYFHHIFPLSAGRSGFGSGGWLRRERWGRAGGRRGGGGALIRGGGGGCRCLTGCGGGGGGGGGIVEENPLAASPGPALVLAEAPEPRAGGEVEAESPR